jgi:hypothetical protein
MRNFNQGFRYNGRNGRDLSVDPEDLMGKMMDPSVVAATPIDNQLNSALSNTTLSSTLASATPEIQQMVCKSLFYIYIYTPVPFGYHCIFFIGSYLFSYSYLATLKDYN